MSAANEPRAWPAALLLLAALGSAIAGCGGDTTDQTSIVVQVDVDPSLNVGADFDQIVVSVKSKRGSFDVPFPVASRSALPVSLALLPVQDAMEHFDVTAAARHQMGTGDVVSQTADVAFLPGQLGRVEIFLADSCRGQVCSGDQTCQAGNCAGTDHPATAITGVVGAPVSDLKVQYLAMLHVDKSTAVQPLFTIVNMGNGGVALEQLTLRYWYVADGAPSPLVGACDYASVDCNNVTLAFQPVTPPRFGADWYFEVGFGAQAGNIGAGGGQVLVQTRFYVPQFAFTFLQSNDFSFDPTKTAYADWPKVTLYQNGTLVWGVEP